MADRIIKSSDRRTGLEEWKYDDATTFELLQRGDTDGVFWLTSRYDKYDLQQLKPSSMDELEFVIAASYPGLNDQIYPYLKNSVLHPDGAYYGIPVVDEIISSTHGVIVYKEQVEAVKDYLESLPIDHSFPRHIIAWVRYDVMQREKHVISHKFVELRAQKVYKTAYLKAHMPDLYDELYSLFSKSGSEDEQEEDESMLKLGVIDEIMLTNAIKQGDEEATNKLVEDNMEFLTKVAKRFLGSGLMLSELIEAGKRGLVEAAKRFEEREGYRFITYAVWWVRQSIMQTIAEKVKDR